nr:MAG TPA: hypothetical protein [Caudoviricetes sp.]
MANDYGRRNEKVACRRVWHQDRRGTRKSLKKERWN